jgi:hypothetical protein
MLEDPGFWAAIVISILVAVAVPLAIEHIRRPILAIEPQNPAYDYPPVNTRWSFDPANPWWAIVHVRVRNLPMAERDWISRLLGHWLTAHAADGCSVRVSIFPGDEVVSDGDEIAFDGKWTSRHEPYSTHVVLHENELRQIDRYDPSKLPGIHEVTLQPGPDGDLVAIAIRERGAANAYAYWAERIYADGRPFPEHPDCELPPGSYRVEVRARAGEVRSPLETFQLTVAHDPNSISLRVLAESAPT